MMVYPIKLFVKKLRNQKFLLNIAKENIETQSTIVDIISIWELRSINFVFKKI
jgi:hypothetical protein